MSFIIDWVIQIIIFILIGTMINLIIPNNKMKKYINIVIGLLLLLTFTGPLIQLLNVDIASKATAVEELFMIDDSKLTDTEKTVDFKKSEIEEQQVAYIWSEVKNKLIVEANPTLLEAFGVVIKDIQFHFIGEKMDKIDELQSMTVVISHPEKDRTATQIDDININIAEQPIGNKRRLQQEVDKVLKEVWAYEDAEMTAEMTIVLEGGKFDQ